MRRHVLGFAVVLGVGCAHGRSPYATTDSTLALDRVVLYRNGVGYFERSGTVEGEVLSLKVRKDQINDLLKSLTVVDRGSGQAVSVSMPLDPNSWGTAALATLAPGNGSLDQVLDALRGHEVTLGTTQGKVRGRLILVEEIHDEPDADPPKWRPRNSQPESGSRDFRVTVMEGKRMHAVRLSKIRTITLRAGDLALQFHRSLDATAGEGMFQQVNVDIRLAGAKRHDLAVSYVVEAPMWKPTYRVVLPESGRGTALLQGWAVVDNTSGEDWSKVTMSLTSGAPIAFRYDLHTPRVVPRSDLTASGTAKQAAVAMGETSYEPEPEPSPVADMKSMVEAEEDADYYDDVSEQREMAKKKAKKDAGPTRSAAARPTSGAKPTISRPAGSAGLGASATPAPAPAPPPAVDLESMRRSTQASARAKEVSGLTQFDLDNRVTVPDGTSTMLAIINQEVDAEETLLYRPGGAGIGYEFNPYRVVRFKNKTPFVLEPGPISIYTGGSFVGEGISEAVGTGTSTTIPFAVESGVRVETATQFDGAELQLVRIVRGVLEVANFQRITTTWSVTGPANPNGFTVLVRQSKQGGNYALITQIDDAETLANAYLIPVKVAPGKTTGTIEVVEQTPSRTELTIWDSRVPALFDTVLRLPNLDAAARQRLTPILALRQEIGRIDTELDGMRRQQVELDHRAAETRNNLEAIKKDPRAVDLRARLNKRLDEFTQDADKLGRTLVELQSRRLEKKIELEDTLQNLDLRFPDPPASAKTPAPQKTPQKTP